MNRNGFVKKQIAELERTGAAALKEQFCELYGFECGATNAKNLRSRIAIRFRNCSLAVFPRRTGQCWKPLQTKIPLPISG